MSTSYLAFDLGASSGRAILGTLNGGTMHMDELHRFETKIVEDHGSLFWDIDSLWQDMEVGLEHALKRAPNLRSLSVDSWAVDYVPLDATGSALRNPFCYRDPRTKDSIEAVYARVSAAEIYRNTGIQFLPFNSIFQIYEDQLARPDEVGKTSTRLLIADYFNYRFSGQPVIEVSNASTTQLVNPVIRNWSEDLIRDLGFSMSRFPIIVDSGTVFPPTESSGGVSVVSGLSHDTAAAIAAIPADDSKPWLFLSSGTWSLLGAEIHSPILTAEAFEESYTNELGLNQTVRFLKNMTGMWALEECIRVWREEGHDIGYTELMDQAEAAGPCDGVVDLDAPEFGERGDMEAKIRAAADRQGIGPLTDRASLVRLILESLAQNYAEKVQILKRFVPVPTDTILHIVGGGSKNALLNQLTANSCGLEVVAGPAESSALGNLLVQARSMGDLQQDETIRGIARNSTDLTRFSPQ
ncbi:MAG: rhamnulokinase [Rhodothermales bacterium]|nr:rhamnulokinase [Rhodothermales bacterium]